MNPAARVPVTLAGRRVPNSVLRQRFSLSGRIFRHHLGLIGFALISGTVLIAVLAPVLAPYSPTRTALPDRLLPPLSRGPAGGVHLLGTDQLGRDVFSRLIFGTRVSLTVGISSTLLAGALGFSAGLASGYRGGVSAAIIMRAVDLQLAFPFILLALAIVAVLGPSLANIVIVFVVTSWPVYARTSRASVLVVRSQEYVEAARSLGAGPLRILSHHILPNVLGPSIVLASFEMARVIIMEAALGFLGLGVPPPTATWGNMLSDGRAYIGDAWWLSVFPGTAIMFLAAGINFVGDALRDVLDPRREVRLRKS